MQKDTKPNPELPGLKTRKRLPSKSTGRIPIASDRIQEFRMHTEWSQEHLSSMTGIALRTINSWENNEDTYANASQYSAFLKSLKISDRKQFDRRFKDEWISFETYA